MRSEDEAAAIKWSLWMRRLNRVWQLVLRVVSKLCAKRALLFLLVLFVAGVLLDPLLPVPDENGE